MRESTLLSVVVFSLFALSGHAEDLSSPNPFSGIKDGDRYVIRRDVDLCGETVELPSDVTLVVRGGVIKNGKLIGNNTKIRYQGPVFDKVSISGAWIVPKIKTSMFRNNSDPNVLKDVFALSSPDVKNRIIVENGDFVLSADKDGETCICVVDNTDVLLRGTISLIPNSLERCYLFRVTGEHIRIKGTAELLGDRNQHNGQTGEWGMGIYVSDGHDVSIEGLRIRDFWGDCICVCHNSSDIIIQNCVIEGGRRQGISIISVNHIIVRACEISNIAGTSPESAVDIEPDRGTSVESVLLENVYVHNCKGGLLVYAKADNSHVGSVVYKNCIVNSTREYPVICHGGDYLEINKCQIDSKDLSYCIYAQDVKKTVVTGSQITAGRHAFRDLSNVEISNNVISCNFLFSDFSGDMENVMLVNNTINGVVWGRFTKSALSKNTIVSNNPDPLIDRLGVDNVLFDNTILKAAK